MQDRTQAGFTDVLRRDLAGSQTFAQSEARYVGTATVPQKVRIV